MDGWIETRSGWMPKDKTPANIRIRRSGSLFKVHANIYGHVRQVHEGDLDTCLHFGDRLREWAASYQAWQARSIKETREGPGPDYFTTVRKAAGDVMAHIAVHAPGASGIAKLTFSHTSHRCCYVVDSLAIDGSPEVSKGFRKRGLSNYMHDLASEIAGLPFVPHGRNLCGGFLTPDGAGFWDARSQTRHVPGHGDPRVAARTERILASEAIPDLERTFRLRSARGQTLALALASIMRGQVAGSIVERDGFDVADCAWFVLPDGRGVFPDGPKTEAAERAFVAELAADGQTVVDIPYDRLVAMATGFRTGREAASFDAWAEVLVDGLKRDWPDISRIVLRHYDIEIAGRLPSALVRLNASIDAAREVFLEDTREVSLS